MTFKHSDEPLNRLAYEFLVRASTLVGASEAAAFAIEGAAAAEGSGDLRLLSHIRADNAPDDARDAAVRGFREIVRPWAAEDRDAVIKVWDAGTGEAQYSLVVRLPDRGRTFAIAAMIVNGVGLAEARERLNSVTAALATAGGANDE